MVAWNWIVGNWGKAIAIVAVVVLALCYWGTPTTVLPSWGVWGLTAIRSNINHLNNPLLQTKAQMALEEAGIKKVICELVEQGFTKDNETALATGRKIYAIGGEAARPIILSYTHDSRVDVAYWATAWYDRYNSGALLDKIEHRDSASAETNSTLYKVELSVAAEWAEHVTAQLKDSIVAAKAGGFCDAQTRAVKEAISLNTASQKRLKELVARAPGARDIELEELLARAKSLQH